ncbi:MAG: hypothetical protein ACHQXA_06925, partial [Gemmatimonadales bacterium]
MRSLLFTLLAMAGAAPLAAQTDCTAGHLPYNSNEARLLRKFEVPLAFSPGGAPPQLTRGQVTIGFDLTYLPRIDSATATPTYCRPGKPAENVNLIAVVPRPRIAIGLGRGYVLEGSWIPPVKLNGVKADLFGFALSRGWSLSDVARFTARLHGTIGQIDANITCTAAQIRSSGPAQCAGLPAPSDDRFQPNIFGIEALVDWTIPGWLFRPYAGVGYDIERPRFQVDPKNTLVNQPVNGNFTRPALFGGFTMRMGRAFDLSGEVYAVPGDAVTGRVGV